MWYERPTWPFPIAWQRVIKVLLFEDFVFMKWTTLITSYRHVHCSHWEYAGPRSLRRCLTCPHYNSPCLYKLSACSNDSHVRLSACLLSGLREGTLMDWCVSWAMPTSLGESLHKGLSPIKFKNLLFFSLWTTLPSLLLMWNTCQIQSP